MSDNITIGTCSQCGGPVQVPRYWACVIPAVPTCAHCGAQASTHGPVIPMITPANRRQIVNRVTSGTGSAS